MEVLLQGIGDIIRAKLRFGYHIKDFNASISSQAGNGVGGCSMAMNVEFAKGEK